MANKYVLLICMTAAMCATLLTATPINRIENVRYKMEIDSEKILDEANFADQDDFNENISTSAAEESDAGKITQSSNSDKLEPEILPSRRQKPGQGTNEKLKKRIRRSLANVKICPLHFIRKNGMCIHCKQLHAC